MKGAGFSLIILSEYCFEDSPATSRSTYWRIHRDLLYIFALKFKMSSDPFSDLIHNIYTILHSCLHQHPTTLTSRGDRGQ